MIERNESLVVKGSTFFGVRSRSLPGTLGVGSIMQIGREHRVRHGVQDGVYRPSEFSLRTIVGACT